MKTIKLKALKEEIQKGLESGESIPFDPEILKKKGSRTYSKTK